MRLNYFTVDCSSNSSVHVVLCSPSILILKPSLFCSLDFLAQLFLSFVLLTIVWHCFSSMPWLHVSAPFLFPAELLVSMCGWTFMSLLEPLSLPSVICPSSSQLYNTHCPPSSCIHFFGMFSLPGATLFGGRLEEI